MEPWGGTRDPGVGLLDPKGPRGSQWASGTPMGPGDPNGWTHHPSQQDDKKTIILVFKGTPGFSRGCSFITIDMVSKMFKAYDLDENGKISFSEFAAGYMCQIHGSVRFGSNPDL